MKQLPTGTVTFLFSDVEGSTRLLHSLGPDAYANQLADHRRILRAAFADSDGVEVDTQGDAFFVAFPTAQAAADAARDVHSSLAESAISVRIGLHTGTPILADEGYVGEDVHRGARIAALAHGGQTLASEATAGLLGGNELRDLGLHRLKDFPGAARVFQVGTGEFPPLRTPGSVDLPTPATPFLGRQSEILDALAIVLDRDPRVLTIVGPGGTGKTRFAIELARLLADEADGGTLFVPLAPVRDAEYVLPALAARIGSATPDVTDVAARIGGRRVHVVLDNLEQLLPHAAVVVGSLITSAPSVRVIATSREPLRIDGEHELDLPPMTETDAVELFLARAGAVRAGLVRDAAVDDLCARLDRLPLALELAAARMKLLTPEQALERLSDVLDLLKGSRNAEERHATLRATIAWSYELLDAEERRLFASLAVFRSAWTLEEAERVCNATVDALASLLDKSLIRRRSEPGEERFFMLETIREFARERLDEDPDGVEVKQRLARRMLELAESAHMSVETGVGISPQRHDLVLGDLDNIRAALDWAAEHDVELGLHLACALENFWSAEPYEGRSRVADLLERARDIDPRLCARALRVRAETLHLAGVDEEIVVAAYEESLAVYERLGDRSGAATIMLRIAFGRAFGGDAAGARELADRGVALGRAAGTPLVEVLAAALEASIRFAEGDLAGAYDWSVRTAEIAGEIGFVWFRSAYLLEATDRGLRLGRPWEELAPLCREAARLAYSMSHRPHAAWALTELAQLELARGEQAHAGRIWGAVLDEIEANPGVTGDRAFDTFAVSLHSATDPLFVDAVAEGRALGLWPVLEAELVRPDREA